jgi:hypothetical protein
VCVECDDVLEAGGYERGGRIYCLGCAAWAAALSVDQHDDAGLAEAERLLVGAAGRRAA